MNDVHPVSPTSPPRRREITVVMLLSAAFVAVLSMWSVLTPMFGAPDEAAHLNSVLRLTQSAEWPAPGEAQMTNAVLQWRAEAAIPASQRSTVSQLLEEFPGHSNGVDQMTQHPPLYYVYGAAVVKLTGLEALRVDHALLVLRLAGLLVLAPLPLLVWDSVRRITRSPKAGVVGAAALFAVPQLAHIGSAVSNEGLIIALCSVVSWLAIRVMTGDDRVRIPIWLGVALGAALLTKGTALPFVPFVLAVLAVWPRDLSLRSRLGRSAIAGVIAFVVGGWWWVRNLVLFGDLQPSGLASQRPTVPWEAGTGPDVVRFVELMWSRVSESFWGAFGRIEFALPEPLTDVLTVLAISAVIAYFFVGRVRSERLQMAFLASLPVLLLVMLFFNTWRHFVRTQLPGGLQGRYFFVVIVALIALSAVAWIRLMPVAARRAAGVVMIALFAGLALLGLFREYIGVYENSLYRVTADALREFAWLTSMGMIGIAAVLAVTIVLLGLAVIAAMRFVLQRPRPSEAVVGSELSGRTPEATSPAALHDSRGGSPTATE